MDEIGCDWIRRQLIRLEALFGPRRPWALLEPTREMYDVLENGDDDGLQAVVARIGQDSLRLSSLPEARYEWALRMSPEVAGEIRIRCGATSLMRIPFFYVGRPYAIGAIVAHELSHQLLAHEGIWEPVVQTNERLTDLAAIAAGMGKLVLNAMSSRAFEGANVAIQLGYLDPQLTLYAYDLVNQHRGVSQDAAAVNLISDVAERLQNARRSPT